MTGEWREAFLAWAQMEEHRRAVEDASERIRQALAAHRQPYIAFSGGKDSTAMLHLVLRHCPDAMVLHWDYGRYYIPRPLHEEILRIARQCGATNLRVETSPLYERLGRRAVNVMGRELLGRLVPQLAEEGYDLCFVGLREQESVKRRHRIRAGRSLTRIAECFPLAKWGWMDVWAYIVAHGLPYLSWYDAIAPVVGYERARFTTLFDPEFRDLGNEQVDNVLGWRWRNRV